MKACFITKPNVTEPFRSSLKLFVQPIAHRDSLYPVATTHGELKFEMEAVSDLSSLLSKA